MRARRPRLMRRDAPMELRLAADRLVRGLLDDGRLSCAAPGTRDWQRMSAGGVERARRWRDTTPLERCVRRVCAAVNGVGRHTPAAKPACFAGDADGPSNETRAPLEEPASPFSSLFFNRISAMCRNGFCARGCGGEIFFVFWHRRFFGGWIAREAPSDDLHAVGRSTAWCSP